MPTTYQSDESNDASSYNATSTDEEDEEYRYEEDEDEEEELGVQSTDAHVKRQAKLDIGKSWSRQGPRTRRTAPVNYTREKIIPPQPPPSQVRMTAPHAPGYF
jgi:hypothetical protein